MGAEAVKAIVVFLSQLGCDESLDGFRYISGVLVVVQETWDCPPKFEIYKKSHNCPSNRGLVVRLLFGRRKNSFNELEPRPLTIRDIQPDADDDTAAFMALLMQHRHRLSAFIAKQLVNPADVEDVFQKTSIVLWKKMQDFDSEGSFFHWACGIAFNEVRNFLTVQRRSRLYFDVELVGQIAREAAEEDSLSESRLDALQHCLKQLSQRQQLILQQCYTGTESITEIAQQLGRERTALYKQLARLREKLLACIRLRLTQDGAVS